MSKITATISAGEELDALTATIVFGFWEEADEHGPQWWGKHSVTKGARAYASCSLPRNLYGSSYRSSNGLPLFSSDNDAAQAVIMKVSERFSTRYRFVEDLRRQMPRAPGGEQVDPAWWVFHLTPAMICCAAINAVSPD